MSDLMLVMSEKDFGQWHLYRRGDQKPIALLVRLVTPSSPDHKTVERVAHLLNDMLKIWPEPRE